MSQEIGPVTVCHSMSLVVTLTKDCASPLTNQCRGDVSHNDGQKERERRDKF